MMLTKSLFQEVEKMQSSYKVIKKDFTQKGQRKVIETEYVIKKTLIEDQFYDQENGEEEIVQSSKIDPEEIMKRYEDIGQRILQDAKNEKQAILLRAQMDANISEKEAYEKGYEQGIKNGYDDGYKKAYDETIDSAKTEAEEIIAKAESLLKSAHENYLKYLEDKKKDVIRLALDIAENITKKELSHEDSMNAIIDEAFRISKGEDNVIIKSNAIHIEELKSQIEIWKISYGIKNEIFILEDNFMEPGNAILEKPSGVIKVGIDIGMEQIKKEIFN